jgi:hypothetical protein
MLNLMTVYSGAMWVWDSARADVAECRLQSDGTYAVLADGKALAGLQASACSFLGEYIVMCRKNMLLEIRMVLCRGASFKGRRIPLTKARHWLGEQPMRSPSLDTILERLQKKAPLNLYPTSTAESSEGTASC